jgi:hypothetical protein
MPRKGTVKLASSFCPDDDELSFGVRPSPERVEIPTPAQERREEASSLAEEVLALGGVPVVTLLETFTAATPIEFAWLHRDLARQQELLTVLDSAPSMPWMEGARAIANGELLEALEIVARLELPVVESYTRLRTAEAFAQARDREEASKVVESALGFFRGAGATRWLRQAEALLAGSP